MIRRLLPSAVFWLAATATAASATPCATVTPQDRGGEVADLFSERSDVQALGAVAQELRPSVVLVWPEKLDKVVNLKAPVVLRDSEGRECEAPTGSGYAAAVRITPAVPVAAIEVPICDAQAGICVYAVFALSDEPR